VEKENLDRLRQNEQRLKADIARMEDELKRDSDPTRDDAVESVLAGREYRNKQSADDVAKSREQLAILQRAIGRQEAIVANERVNASRSICATVKVTHEKLQREMALAIIAAAKASLGAQTLRSDLASADVQLINLGVVAFRGLDTFATVDACSGLAYYVRESLETGILNRNDLPHDWLKNWGVSR
jgi:hypothetical protein